MEYRDNHWPLNYTQLRLAIANTVADDKSVFNVGEFVSFSDNISLAKLKQAIITIHQFNDGFSLRYRIAEHNIFQEKSSTPVEVIPIKLSDPAVEPAAKADFAKRTTQPLAPEKGVTIRHYLYFNDVGCCFWGIIAHHIATDYWGIGQLIHDVLSCYERQTFHPTSAPVFTYQAYLNDVKYKANAHYANNKEYWNNYLNQLPKLEDYARKRLFPSKAIKVSRPLTANNGSFTFNDKFMMILALCLKMSKRGRLSTSIINLPFSNRRDKGEYCYYRPAMNTLPLMVSLTPQATIKQILVAMQSQMSLHSKHSRIDINDLNDEAISRADQFTAAPYVNLLHELEHDLMKDNRAIRGCMTSGAVNNYGINIRFSPNEKSALVELDVGSRLYSHFAADVLIDDYLRIYSIIAENINETVEAYWKKYKEIKPIDNITSVLWNPENIFTHHPIKESILARIAQVVEISPDKKSVIYGNQAEISSVHCLNYHELYHKLLTFSQLLLSCPLQNRRVAVLLPRGVESLLSILSIHTAGLCFVPINMTFSHEEINSILDGLNISLLITARCYHEKVNGINNTHLLFIEDIETRPSEIFLGNDIKRPATQEDEAYIFFTSGTTGAPKAVPITFKGLYAYLAAMTTQYGIKQDDVILNFSTPVFDAYIEEVFGCFYQGATLAIADDHMIVELDALFSFCHAQSVTIVNFPTNYWHQIVFFLHAAIKELAPSIRMTIIGGDLAMDKAIHHWLEKVGCGISLINSYGPTECCVVASCHNIDDKFQPGNIIGKALTNSTIVIREYGTDKIISGSSGEICIRGDSICTGYINDNQSTSRKFLQLNDGEIYYLTGDRGFYDDQGNLNFIGRLDKERKIDGKRVDLDEMQKLLTAAINIDDIHLTIKENETGYQYINIFIPDGSYSITRHEIVSFLRGCYPKLQVPFIVELAVSNDVALVSELNKEDNISQIKGEKREIFFTLWREVFGDSDSVIDEETNFFDAGGTSLKALLLINKIQQRFNCSLHLEDFYHAPRVGYLLQSIIQQGQIPVLTDKNSTCLTEQHDQYYWIIDTISNRSGAHNIPLYYHLTGEIDLKKLRYALLYIMQYFPALRQRITITDGQLSLTLSPAAEENLPFEYIDLTYATGINIEISLRKILNDMAFKPMALQDNPPVYFKLLKIAEHEHYLLLNFHHAFCDGMSIAHVLQKLSSAYADNVPKIEAATKTGINVINQRMSDETLNFWTEKLFNVLSAVGQRNDTSEAHQRSRGRRYSMPLSPQLIASLSSTQKKYAVTLEHIVIGAFLMTINSLLNKDEIIVGIPCANRVPPISFDSVGSFATTLLLPYVTTETSLINVSRYVRDFLADANTHSNISLAYLKQHLHHHHGMQLPEVTYYFSSQIGFETSLYLGETRCTKEKIKGLKPKGDIALELINLPTGIGLEWLYDDDIFSEDIISDMGLFLIDLLDCMGTQHDLMPSDTER
ncbi:condensation domain-containing protein [Photorhabdus aegyptia]|uniref:condensation domain-containing protein n=1 Tax=Photorhabdus aegyptia TaxID=2805098 RepID=UPI001E4ED745|nr:condensation domain-containing protein [Photorhabdus aegyptia]MCC8456969.1 AMP-binding protein [Photorhabdus aegyptia]